MRLLAILLLVTIILATPILTFPNYLFFIFAGLNFGGFVGGTITSVAIIISSLLGYKMGDIASSDGESNNKYIRKFEIWVDKYGLKALIILRIAPLLPYNTVAFGSGLTKIPFKSYFISSVISLSIGSYFWAYMGEYFAEYLLDRLTLNIGWPHLIGFIILIVFIFVLRSRRSSNTKANVENNDSS